MKVHIKAILAVLAYSIASVITLSSAHADGLMPDYAMIPLASHHYGDWGDKTGDHFNEINPGLLLGWEKRAGGLNYTIGAYRDSASDMSLHLSAAKMWDIAPDTEIGLVGAYVQSFGDGYSGPAPSLQLRYKALFLNAATGYDDGVYGVISTGFVIPLGQ